MLDARLSTGCQLGGSTRGLTDAAVMPFVRQFAAVEPEWFSSQPLPHLKVWLEGHLRSDLFAAIMVRNPAWTPGDPPTFFSCGVGPAGPPRHPN
jgi:glutathione S-transferase